MEAMNSPSELALNQGRNKRGGRGGWGRPNILLKKKKKKKKRKKENKRKRKREKRKTKTKTKNKKGENEKSRPRNQFVINNSACMKVPLR